MDCWKIVGCADKHTSTLCSKCGNKYGDEDCEKLIEAGVNYYIYKLEKWG